MATNPLGEKVFYQSPNLTVNRRSDSTAVLLLHVAGRSVNVLNRQVLADLEAALDIVASESALRCLVITSDRPSGFLAGADIHEFANIRGAEEAEALSGMGQRLFDKLAQLRMPTVAVVHGSCLGGGLELALACDYRIALDHAKTQFGFPEIQLGLLPAWGGTQRLPRAVGLERALQMILGDRRLTAREALRWGLMDLVSPSVDNLSAMSFTEPESLAGRGKRSLGSLPLRTWRQRFLESTRIGRSLIFRGAERILGQRVPDDMPAPREAMEAVRTGLKQGMPAGMEYERKAAGRLAMSNACRNLVRLFFQREEARALPSDASPAPPVKHVAVIGAGAMGAGIAQLAALKGCDVMVHEVNADALGKGLLRIAALFEKAAERGLLSLEESRKKLSAIRGTTKWERLDEVELVVEAVIEDLEAKQAVFRELEQRTRPDALLATNTSSLPVSQLQEDQSHPGRIAGLHFFNPVHKMPLVEVVRGPATEEKTIATLVRWAVALGKTPVVIKDSPGFVVNRILTPYLNEAVILVAEGMEVASVDQVMRRFGMPMGPLELLDQVGLDVAAHIARSLEPIFGPRFTKNPVFERMREKGWLGQKAGAGFYRYRGKTRQPHLAATGLVRVAIPSPESLMTNLPPAVRLQQARERMVLLMVNEAAACLGEGLAADAGQIDLAMVLGTGWAPHRGGPLRYADDRGASEIFAVLTELVQRHGMRFEPCPELRRRAEARRPFHEAADLRREGK